MTTQITDANHIAQGFLDSHFIYDPGGDAVRDGRYTLRYWRDDFYVWDAGRYCPLTDAELGRQVSNHLHMINLATQDAGEELALTAGRMANIRFWLLGHPGIGIPESRELNSWPDGREFLVDTLAFNNGLLMIPRDGGKQELAAHTPDFFSVTKLPYNYDPDAKCPMWESFVNDSMLCDGEYIALIRQWCGYLFRPDLREQKFLLCCGEGANGKGVFFEVVQSLVGKENCSQVPIARFGHPFTLATTLGKVVNLTHESSHIIDEQTEAMLKSFTAGDRMTFERKYREPVHVVPTAKIMIATNALPRFNDKTAAIWRRMLVVPFDKVIPYDQQIKDLADQLKRELPGILNWALEGLADLTKAGGFTMPRRHVELLNEYRRDADPARAFLEDYYAYSSNGDDIPCFRVYGRYREWCERTGHKPMNDRTFGRQVGRTFPGIDRTRVQLNGTRAWVYRGLVAQQTTDFLDMDP
ncbi:MAG: DNA primase family protein [Planctomycetota bacterium]